MNETSTALVARVCAYSTSACSHCPHVRPHICTRPSDVCVYVDAHGHRRLNVECEPIPPADKINELSYTIEELQDEIDNARGKVEAAEDDLDEAKDRLRAAEKLLSEQEQLSSARDYCEGDQLAIAALPVI
jgi:vacuolar-type H+-ATPase subunit I/STV1